MNDALIQEILSIPSESRTIEFKRLGGRNSAVNRTLESVVAMANTDGGLIVLGVDDPTKTKQKGSNRIYGIEENVELFDEIGRTLRKVVPPISNIWPPELIYVPEKEVQIGLLAVPKVSDGFRSFENHVYVRLERGNKRLSPQEIIHFSYVKGFERADKELVDVEFSLLETDLYDMWRTSRKIKKEKITKVLEKTGLARKEKGRLKPTCAAVLLFADYPTDLMDAKCAIRILQYEGNMETVSNTLNVIGKPITINGPAVKLIEDASETVLNLLRSGIRFSGGFVTKYRIPERAVQEAITNAVIHRDYHTKKRG